ncbi:MAG: LLM class F420-dependent oxidoreductase [Desulfurellaceae bacterium]|nr:LLM class F420-dependent oxidoreductase [Desulfurellaceae bacterium]
MDLGVFSFNTEYTLPADELAKECEARGFESLWLPEHTHIPASRESQYPGGGELPEEYVHMSDPFIGLAAAAAVTTRLKLGTGISLVTEHDPIVQAKQVASLDRISHGRFLFGIGAGWNKEEMANHGTPPAKRWKVLTERVQAMKALWTQDEASYHGEFVNFDRVWSYPKPLTTPHPPILMGSLSSRLGRQRVVDLCDGWIPVETAIDDMPAAIADLHDKARAAGRDPASIPISFFLVHAPGMGRLARYKELGAVRTVVRAPTAGREEILPFLDKYAEVARQLG